MQEALTVLTVVIVGVMVGVEFAVAAFMNPIFDRLPNDGGLAARSNGARLLGRVMPVWYIGSVVLGALWVVLAWGQPEAWSVAAAAALLAVSIVISVVVLVPINSRVARWSDGDAPTDWAQQVHRWDRIHYARLAIIITGFVLLVVAAAT